MNASEIIEKGQVGLVGSDALLGFFLLSCFMGGLGAGVIGGLCYLRFAMSSKRAAMDDKLPSRKRIFVFRVSRK